jgi:hypothetical protein
MKRKYCISRSILSIYGGSIPTLFHQTPVYFEMPLNTTVHKKGDKNITVRTGGNEKQWCTVMLCITADGRKLPPYIVLKRKILPKVNVKGVFIQAQESGWMDQAMVLDWINHVWQKRPGALLNLRRMLILEFPWEYY